MSNSCQIQNPNYFDFFGVENSDSIFAFFSWNNDTLGNKEMEVPQGHLEIIFHAFFHSMSMGALGRH